MGLARQRSGADQALGCARSRVARVSANSGNDPSCMSQVRSRARPRSLVPAVSRVSAPLKPGWQVSIPLFRLPSGRRPEQGLWCRVPRQPSLEKSGSSHAVARVPPDFAVPAPCVGSPSCRRRADALTCSAQPKSTGAFRADRSVEASATGGSGQGREATRKTAPRRSHFEKETGHGP